MNATNGNTGINNNGINNNSGNSNSGIDLVELLERLGQYFIENIAAICTVVVILIGVMVYQQIMYVQHGTDISGSGRTGKLSQTVVVEPFLPGSDSLDAKLKAGFCKSYLGKPAELETECGKMSKNSCTATSCCVWARMGSAESCVSGNEYGPIFKNNPNGSPKPLDYYYFENKCSGNCPKP
jgi:hypothetical protein